MTDPWPPTRLRARERPAAAGYPGSRGRPGAAAASRILALFPIALLTAGLWGPAASPAADGRQPTAAGPAKAQAAGTVLKVDRQKRSFLMKAGSSKKHPEVTVLMGKATQFSGLP